MLENNERRLVTAAGAIVRSLPDNETHTVASAAMDTHGNVHTGVNVFHFTGGPCAELVVIAAAAQALAGPLVTIVAVGDRDRGVLAPCGRCRQVLLDLHPDLAVILSLPDGDVMADPLRDLLPRSYLAARLSGRRIRSWHEPSAPERATHLPRPGSGGRRCYASF